MSKYSQGRSLREFPQGPSFKKIENSKKGYAIIELLFYIAFFTLLSLVAINAMVVMTRAFRETAIQSELLQSGNIMERITREIRQAYGINAISASDLTLNTKDAAGADKTVRFFLSGTNLQMLENGVLTGNLNASNISVTAATFTQINTLKGKAVKIFLTVKSDNDKLNRTKDFYNTVVLRGGY